MLFSLGFEGKKRSEHLKVGKNSPWRRNSTENKICRLVEIENHLFLKEYQGHTGALGSGQETEGPVTKGKRMVQFGLQDDPRGNVSRALGGSHRLGSREPH